MLRFALAPFALVFYLLTLPFRLLMRRIPRGAYVLVELDGAVADFVGEPSLVERIRTLGQKPVFSLHGLSKLGEVFLKGTKATDAGVKALAAAIPDVKISR